MNRFARAGYATALVNPILAICPAQCATCINGTRLLRTPLARMKSEAARLLDLSLFRIMPVRLKRRIYREGNWLISGRVDRPDGVALVLEGNQLEEVARRLTVVEGAPTLKFLAPSPVRIATRPGATGHNRLVPVNSARMVLAGC